MMEYSSDIERPVKKESEKQFTHKEHRYSKSKLLRKDIEMIIKQK